MLGYGSLGNRKLWLGQLDIRARAVENYRPGSGNFFRAVEIFVRAAKKFRPGSRKIMVWEAEIFISGSRIIIFV